MKKILILAILAAAVVYGAMYLFDADVSEGELPNVSVTGGEMPGVNIEGPDVDAGMVEKTIEVPTITMEERVIEVPDVNVDLPNDTPELPDVPDVDVQMETKEIEVPSGVNME